MIALGLQHLPHDVRHTFISRMDSAGANNTVIKRIVGHAGKGITEKVYTHKEIDELKAGIEMITYKAGIRSPAFYVIILIHCNIV